MCEFTNVDYYSIDFHEDRWYTKASWSHAQEKQFKEWFTNHLLNSKSARKFFMHFETKGLKAIKCCVDTFCFNYGWSND